MTTKTYGMELRELIVSARAQGHSASEIARWFKVSKRSVERYWAQHLQTRSVEPKQRGGYRRSRLEGHEQTLRDWIRKQPDLTLEEMQARCLEDLKIQIGINALWTRLDQLGLTFKKNATRQRARSA